MNPTLLTVTFEDMTEADYQSVIEEWKAIQDKDASKEFYEKEVLPRSCYRIRRQTPDLEPVSLLLVPVGTQPYAPLMVCLGTPAHLTVLLATEKSLPFAHQVRDIYQDTRQFQIQQISETDSGDITQKVQALHSVLGQPKDVLCDITGGTKVMTSTLAGIAALNGWKQIYVNSQFIGNKGSHHEQIITITSPFEHLGGWHRAQARALASAGRFDQAAHSLKAAAEISVASGRLQLDIKHYELAFLYRSADLVKLRRLLPSAAKKLKLSLPDTTWHALAEGPRQGFDYWVASTHHRERQPLAAVGALSRSGISTDPDSLAAVLRELKASKRAEWELPSWKPLDHLLGAAYSRRIASDA